MGRHTVLAAAALITGVTAAGAAYAAPPFDGAYLGAHIGYGMSSTDLSVTNTAVGGSGSADALDTRGAALGLLAGYGRTFGSFYAGGELDAGLSDFEGSASGSVGPVSGRTKVWTHWTGSASVRAGYLPAENLLLYGRLGATRTQFKANERDSTGGQASVDTGRWGLTVGGGIEAALAEHISVRGEYLYTWYDDVDFTTGPTSVSLSPNIGVFRAALVYTF